MRVRPSVACRPLPATGPQAGEQQAAAQAQPHHRDAAQPGALPNAGEPVPHLAAAGTPLGTLGGRAGAGGGLCERAARACPCGPRPASPPPLPAPLPAVLCRSPPCCTSRCSRAASSLRKTPSGTKRAWTSGWQRWACAAAAVRRAAWSRHCKAQAERGGGGGGLAPHVACTRACTTLPGLPQPICRCPTPLPAVFQVFQRHGL